MPEKSHPLSNRRFQLLRVAGLFKALLKNRMAALGLMMLIISGIVAVTAPLIAPYPAIQTVAGPQAQPEWVMNFPDGYYLSRNLQASLPRRRSKSCEWTGPALPCLACFSRMPMDSGTALTRVAFSWPILRRVLTRSLSAEPFTTHTTDLRAISSPRSYSMPKVPLRLSRFTCASLLLRSED